MLVFLAVFITYGVAAGSLEDACPNGNATLITYNTGLNPTVHGYKERRKTIPAVVSTEATKSEADFLCLQEVWYEEDVNSVLEAIESDFPYHFSAIHHDLGELRDDRRKRAWSTVPCNAWKFTKLMGCLTWNCTWADDQQSCMFLHCGHRLFDLSQECLSCIIVSSSSFTDMMTMCATSGFSSYNRFNGPGLLVASKRPMAVSYTRFDPGYKVVLERGYIKAKVDNMTYVCTHLTGDLRTSYFEASKHSRQRKFKPSTPRYRAHRTCCLVTSIPDQQGDENGSGDVALTGELEDNYRLLEARGYLNPYFNNNGKCTYCDSNPILQGSAYGDLLIDHVLTYNLPSDVSTAERLFDETEEEQLSDHYGTKLGVCLP
ncbi:hypothetical protein BaRGS_00026039 [Batillaria attramentaria]|uniref:Endonuclease/exonuclease/phosphatase domain-containing protein n=1 Tax=Batillaria attramentaria TaxID=370345 RepID=A0ABD0K6Z8_9CAEN